jgi:hypothetical protein
MRLNSVAWVVVLMGTGPQAAEKNSETKDCPMHQEHMAQGNPNSKDTEAHFAGVTERGDKAMGFSHEKTVHHFGLTRSGGFISAEASDPADTASRDAIRQHFEHITSAFSAGNFELPMLIHAKTPPGVETMKKRKALIRYSWEATDRGGRVVISTADGEALRAVHRFLRFQIKDHRTRDSVAVTN